MEESDPFEQADSAPFALEAEGSSFADRAAALGDNALWGVKLLEMVEVAAAHFQRRGMSPDQALEEARSIVAAWAHHSGGKLWYLPKGTRLKAALQHQEIWRRYNGRNVRELAAEFGLSEIFVYRVIDKQRRLAKRLVQPELFGEPKDPREPR